MRRGPHLYHWASSLDPLIVVSWLFHKSFENKEGSFQTAPTLWNSLPPPEMQLYSLILFFSAGSKQFYWPKCLKLIFLHYIKVRLHRHSTLTHVCDWLDAANMPSAMWTCLESLGWLSELLSSVVLLLILITSVKAKVNTLRPALWSRI